MFTLGVRMLWGGLRAVSVADGNSPASVRRWMQDPRYQRWMNLVAGTLFVITGVLLAIANIRVWSAST